MHRTIERLSDQCERQAHEIVGAVELAKEAVTSMKREDFEIEEKRNQAQMISNAFKQVTALGMPLIRQLSGGIGGAPVLNAADSSFMNYLAENILADNLPALMKKLLEIGLPGEVVAILNKRLRNQSVPFDITDTQIIDYLADSISSDKIGDLVEALTNAGVSAAAVGLISERMTERLTKKQAENVAQ
jgi:uncharacterized protein YidB (DUF937 family)